MEQKKYSTFIYIIEISVCADEMWYDNTARRTFQVERQHFAGEYGGRSWDEPATRRVPPGQEQKGKMSLEPCKLNV